MDQKPKSWEMSSSTPNQNLFWDSFPRAMRVSEMVCIYFSCHFDFTPGHPSVCPIDNSRHTHSRLYCHGMACHSIIRFTLKLKSFASAVHVKRGASLDRVKSA